MMIATALWTPLNQVQIDDKWSSDTKRASNTDTRSTAWKEGDQSERKKKWSFWWGS